MDTHNEDSLQYLRATDAIDCDNPAVIQFASDISKGMVTDIERATALYYAVRDSFRYDPYRFDLTLEGMRASTTLANGYGFCIPKAVLLAASARVLGIPSRLGFVDVKNHLATERLLTLMQTDLFVFHGYVELYLQGAWVKATPAFNVSLCERFNVDPLDFDGRTDAVFQQFDKAGNQFMQYVQHRGTFADLPVDLIRACFEEHYPALAAQDAKDIGTAFEDEIET